MCLNLETRWQNEFDALEELAALEVLESLDALEPPESLELLASNV